GTCAHEDLVTGFIISRPQHGRAQGFQTLAYMSMSLAFSLLLSPSLSPSLSLSLSLSPTPLLSLSTFRSLSRAHVSPLSPPSPPTPPSLSLSISLSLSLSLSLCCKVL